MKFGTKPSTPACILTHTGAIMTPIYQTSTYVQRSPGDHKGYEYSAPTTLPAPSCKTRWPPSKTASTAWPSPPAWPPSMHVKLLQPGDEVISTNDLYGGSYRIFTKVFARLRH